MTGVGGKAWRLFRNALSLLGVWMLVVSFTPITDWWTLALAGPWYSMPPGARVLVLGSDIQGDGQLGLHSYQRCVHVVRLWRGGGISEIVVSGGGKPQPVAAAMREFLISQGVPAESIRMEAASANTYENVLMGRKLLEGPGGPVVILTSDYHMGRSTKIAQKMGWAITPHPVPDLLKLNSIWWFRWQSFVALGFESAKYPYYAWKGRI